MHLFVRDLSGNSLSFDVDTATELAFAICDRTGIPVDQQRLIYGSIQLTNRSNAALAEAGLKDGVTINLALRLRGGGPKKRCGCYITTTERCSSAAVRIVGDCSFCDVSFCGRHRLPEDHKCPNLSTCRQDAFLRNKAKLESEQTVGRKIEGM